METREVMNRRIVGDVQGDREGKLLVFTAGMHGNETSGIVALERVIHHLTTHKLPIVGRVVGLYGNLKAIDENQRYIDYDFNRIWTTENLRRVKSEPEEMLDQHELKELKGLLESIDPFLEGVNPKDVAFFDLHNTSSSRGLFSITFNRKDNIDIAACIQIPIIVGLIAALQGTAIEYFNDQGYVALAFEGGMIGDEKSIAIHEAGIWILMEASGVVTKEQVPDYSGKLQLLSEASREFPTLTDLAYVHKITPKDQFVMRPGYLNFQKIHEGEHLADDVNGEIRSPCSGYILMPLYQKQGGEGFFIIRDLQRG